jgi:hypothetical protein
MKYQFLDTPHLTTIPYIISTDAATVWVQHWNLTPKLLQSPHECHVPTKAAAVSCIFLDRAAVGCLALNLDLSRHTDQGMEVT